MKSHHEVAQPYKEIAHSVSDEALDEAVATSHMLSAETGFKVLPNKNQSVPVNVVRGIGNTTVLELLAVTDEPGRESTPYLAGTVGAYTGANVLTIGNPGVEQSKHSVAEKGQRNALAMSQARELYSGNFDKVSQAIAHAAMRAMEMEGLEDNDVLIVAPSLAGSVASAGVQHMVNEGVNIRGIGLIDPVGLSEGSGLSRLKQFASVDASAAPYLEANHPKHAEITESTGEWIKRSANSLPANLLYGIRGVSLGGAKGDLLRQADILRENDISLRIYAAGRSEFDTAQAGRETTEELARHGVDADITIIDGASHAMSMAAGMHARVVADFIKDLELS